METLSVALTSCAMTPNYPIATTTFDDGSEQVAALNDSMMATWSCSTPQLTAADYATFLAFWNARGGGLQAFYWTPPLPHVQTQYTVRFVDGSLKIDPGVSRMSVSFGLRKVA